LVRSLSEAGFFVEPNVALLDRRTGKSREVDLVAEFYEHNPKLEKISVRTHFVVEAINNSLPIVAMTEHPESPITDIDAFVRYATTPSDAPFQTRVDVFEGKGVFTEKRYSQYCGITRKKAGDELMASHPEDLYSSLLKIAEFIEQQASEFESRQWPPEDPYWRLWFWQGVLVVGGEILTLDDSADGMSLVETPRAPLVFNFHVGEQPKTVVIQLVRERELLPFARRVIEEDRTLALEVNDVRSTFQDRVT
jgi:hypothetical protein